MRLRARCRAWYWNNREWFWFVGSLLMVVLGVTLAGLRGSMVPESTVFRTLEAHGFSAIRITDRSTFLPITVCQGDAARFKASAINPVGHRVIVYVCAGWPLKGATVRIDVP